MFDNGKYVLPLKLVALLEDADLSFEELRLIHGLLHCAHVAANCTPSALWASLGQVRKIRSTKLRHTVGPKNAKDHRQLAKLVGSERLRPHFKLLELSKSHRALSFQFQNKILDASIMRNFDPKKTKAPYALLDVADVARCRSRTDLLFFVRTAMHRRQNTPTFALPGIGEGERSTAWPVVRDKWLRSATKEASASGVNFLVLLEEGLEQLNVERVRVKITHADTSWKPGALYSYELGTTYVEVRSCGHTYLGAAEARAKRGQIRVI